MGRDYEPLTEPPPSKEDLRAALLYTLHTVIRWEQTGARRPEAETREDPNRRFVSKLFAMATSHRQEHELARARVKVGAASDASAAAGQSEGAKRSGAPVSVAHLEWLVPLREVEAFIVRFRHLLKSLPALPQPRRSRDAAPAPFPEDTVRDLLAHNRTLSAYPEDVVLACLRCLKEEEMAKVKGGNPELAAKFLRSIWEGLPAEVQKTQPKPPSFSKVKELRSVDQAAVERLQAMRTTSEQVLDLVFECLGRRHDTGQGRRVARELLLPHAIYNGSLKRPAVMSLLLSESPPESPEYARRVELD